MDAMDSFERALFEMSSSGDEGAQVARSDIYVHTAVALFDYVAVEADELSFRRGDHIVIYGTPEEDWYEGELNDLIGMIPANYVRLLPKQDASPHEDKPDDAGQNEENLSQGSGKAFLAGSESWGIREVSEENSAEKDIHDRLYDDGVTHIKRQQFLQEMSRNKDREEIQNHQFKAGTRSKKIAAHRKPENGNYGEFLYNEGMAKQQKRAERTRMQKEQEALQDRENTFTPKICRYSKSLVRDMPVVDRLLLLEQVKVDKLDAMKKEKAMEQAKECTYTPPASNTWRFDTPRSSVSGTDQGSTIQRVRREMLQEKIDRELGRTFTPTICPKSKKIARSIKKARRSDGNDVFNRLYRDGERNAMRLEVKTIEATLTALDLADGGKLTKPKEKTPADDKSSLPESSAVSHSIAMYERSKVKKLQTELLERQRQELEKERRTPSKAPKSETLSRDRLRRECRSVIEVYGATVEGTSLQDVSFGVFEHMVRDLAAGGRFGHELGASQSEEEKMILDRMWTEVLQTQGADDLIGLDEGDKGLCPAEELAEMCLLLHEGETFGIENREPVDVGRAALITLQELAKSVIWKRMSNKPVHMVRAEKKGLEQRLQSLSAQAIMEFAKIATDLGLKTTENESRELFRFYSEEDRCVHYDRFAVEAVSILSPRRRAIERALRRFDGDGDGRVHITELVESQDQRHGEPFLVKTTEKLLEVRRRLVDMMKHLPAANSVESVSSSTVNTPRSTTKASSETSGEFLLFDSQEGMRQRSSDGTGGLGLDGPHSDMPRFEYLHQLSKRRLESTFEMRRKLDEKEMEHCTFKPLINTGERKGDRQALPIGERLYATAKDKAPEVGEFIPSWEQRELEHCTFRPKINKNPAGERSTPREKRRPDARQGTPREQRRQAFPDTLRATETEFRAEEANRDRSVAPQPTTPSFHMDKRQRDRNPPALFVDINLGPGKVGRIGLHKGDDPSVLAQNFCKTYTLDERTKTKLTAMLQEQLKMINVDMS